jgi:hypothetical protein
MRGRADQVLDFDDSAAPSAAFRELLAAAFDEAMTASSLCAAALTVGFRLSRVVRILDLPAPWRSLKVAARVRQCGDETDARGTRRRPRADAGDRQLGCRFDWAVKAAGVFSRSPLRGSSRLAADIRLKASSRYRSSGPVVQFTEGTRTNSSKRVPAPPCGNEAGRSYRRFTKIPIVPGTNQIVCFSEKLSW